MPSKEAYRKNPEKYKAASRKWSRENPDKRRASWRKSEAKHRAKRNRKKREYYRGTKQPSSGVQARMLAYSKKTNNPPARYVPHTNPAKAPDAKCVCCGASEKIQRDHIIPLSCGGGHYKEQTQPLCLSCNYSKLDGTHCRLHAKRLAPNWWLTEPNTVPPKINTFGTL